MSEVFNVFIRVEKDLEVHDEESMESAEDWVRNNLDSLIGNDDVEILVFDNDKGDKYYVSYEMMGHHHEGFKTLEEATKKVEETGCLEHHGNEVEECKAIAIYERETGQEVWSL